MSIIIVVIQTKGFSQDISHKVLKSKYLQTGELFESNDTLLKKLFDVTEAKAVKNVSIIIQIPANDIKLI